MSDLDPNDQLGQYEESRSTSENIGGVTGLTEQDTRKGTKMNDPESPNTGVDDGGVDDGTEHSRKPDDTRAGRKMESVKKPKVPKTTRAAKKLNTDTKGDPATTKSFLDAFKTEPKCAAYLGYTDIAEYRKFQLSDICIESYLFYEKYCTGISSKLALELLSDERTKRSLGDPYQTLKNHPVDHRGKEKKNESGSGKYLLASVILQLTENIDKGQPERTTEDAQLAHATAVGKLAKAVTQIIPHDYDITTIQYPRLGPHTDLGEDPLERYNRVYNLLRSMNHTLQPSRWKDKFGGLNSRPFESTRIHASHVPLWMVPVENASRALLRKARPPPLSKKVIKLTWNDQVKTRSAEALKTHIEEYIKYEDREHLLPREPAASMKDPRMFPTGQMWRDTVRRQLSFEKLRVEFVTMELQDGDKRMTIFATQGKAAVWDDIVAQLRANDVDVSVVYTLRPLDEDEEFQLEYEGPPLALLEDVRLGEDNDVEERPLELQEDPVLSDITEKRQYEEEMAENSAFLSGGGNSLGRGPPVPQTEFAPEDREAMLAHHDGYDVFTPEGLRDWQLHVCNKICREPTKAMNPTAFKGRKNVTKEQKQELARLREEGEQKALSIDAEEMTSQGRYYSIQKAFTGSDEQVGPPIDICKIAWDMKTTGKHGQKEDLDVSTCMTLPGCDIKFLDSQINGAMFMAQRSTGGPIIGEDRQSSAELDEAKSELESLTTGGGYLVDSTGLGKTITALLFVSQFALHHDHKGVHRPTLITVPNGAVFSQWVDTIWEHFQDLNVIISNDDKPMDAKYAQNWISSTAVREAPKNLDQWPEDLRYVFDTTDPRASRTVIVSPYDTHKDRTVMVKWVMKTKGVRGHKKRSKRKHRDEVAKFTSRWKGIFAMVICDEGHRIRHVETKTYASIKLLEASINWFLTATPIMNSSLDILGGLIILWPAIKKRLLANSEAVEWLKSQPHQSYRILDSLEDLPKNDIRRTIALDPLRMEKLLVSENVTHIAKYYHYMDELLSVRRSTASVLKRNEEGDTVSLRSMMPKHHVRTVELSYDEEEETEAQWLHRLAARSYVEAATSAMQQEAVSVLAASKSTGPDTYKERKSFPATTGALRRLAITSKSTKLARLDIRMRALGYNTLVKNMEGYRSKGHSADWFIQMTYADGDLPIETRLEKLQYLAEGSPTLRYILSHVRDHLLQEKNDNRRPDKLLVAEDTPIVAWFWELALNYLYIETKVLHSGLNNEERTLLVKSFNNPRSSLKMLVLMYNVGSQGTNLDPCCNNVIVATGAINASLEVQAWGRVIRVSQKYEVHVHRCKTLNSHDQHRDARQMDKAIMDMATRSHTNAIRSLLVDLLNEGNAEVQKAHDNKMASSLGNDQALTSSTSVAKEVEELGGASSPAAAEAPVSRPLRQRNKVSRLVDDVDFWGDDFDLGETLSSSSSSSEEDYSDMYSEAESDSDGKSTSSSGSSRFDPLSRDDNPGDEQAQDDGNDIVLRSRTYRSLRESYSKLTRKQQEDFDQDTLHLRTLLRLSPTRVYTLDDLDDPEIHDRALRLLYRARFGQENEYIRVGPHIKYNKLAPEVVEAIKQKMTTFDSEVAYYTSVIQKGLDDAGPQHIAATQALMKAKATRKRQSKEKKTGAAKRQKVSESARTQTRSEGSPIEGTALSREAAGETADEEAESEFTEFNT